MIVIKKHPLGCFFILEEDDLNDGISCADYYREN